MEYLEPNYGLGKAQAESFLIKHSDFPVSQIRLAHVLSGHDDFTKRLRFYVEKILKNEVIEIEAECGKNSFIQVDEAADLLKWVGFHDIVGPLNACSNQSLTAHELIAFIASVLKKSPRIQLVSRTSSDKDGLTPFSQMQNLSLNNCVATRAGYSFSNLLDWLPEIILQIARDIDASTLT